MQTDSRSATGRARPISKEEVGLRAVAEVNRVKGSLGVAALTEAQAQTAGSRKLESDEALRARVQKIYDKKVNQRKKLADVVPTNPEGDLTQPANKPKKRDPFFN